MFRPLRYSSVPFSKPRVTEILQESFTKKNPWNSRRTCKNPRRRPCKSQTGPKNSYGESRKNPFRIHKQVQGIHIGPSRTKKKIKLKKKNLRECRRRVCKEYSKNKEILKNQNWIFFYMGFVRFISKQLSKYVKCKKGYI